MKSKDRTATESALINAATRIFAEKGYDKSKTKEIAAAADCNEALIQRYFDGKDGLLLAVLKAGSDRQNPIDIERLPFHENLEDEIMQLFEATKVIMHARSNEIKIVFSQLLIDSEFYKKFLQISLIEDYQLVLVERLRHYQQSGKIDQHIDLKSVVILMQDVMLQICFVKTEVFRLSNSDFASRVRLFCRVLVRGVQ